LTNTAEALGPRWTPRHCVLSRTDSYGYRHSLRPCLGTTSTPRRRAAFRQSLLHSRRVLASVSGSITSFVGDHGVYAVFLLMAIDAVFPAASELV